MATTFEEERTDGVRTQARSPTPKVFVMAEDNDFSGRTLEQRYALVRKIGAGSFATVYLAQDLRMFGRKVAVKVLHPEQGANPVNVERFVQEMKVAAKLDGPYRDRVVEIIDHGTCAGDPPLLYFVMEYVDGISLHSLLTTGEDGQRRRRPMPWIQATTVIQELVKALATLHACGVVHRDIKPGNVIIEQKPDGDFLKLLDLGIAKVLPGHEISDHGPRTHPEFVLGTPRYMAPEQFAGAIKDARVDLYAAGVMLYEFLTGDVPSRWFERPGAQHPYMPIPPSQANPGVGIPPRLDAVALRAVAFEPDARFQSAGEFAGALAEILLAAEHEQARVRALAEVGGRPRALLPVGLRTAFAVGDFEASGWVALRWWIMMATTCAALSFVVAIAAAIRRDRPGAALRADTVQAMLPRPAKVSGRGKPSPAVRDASTVSPAHAAGSAPRDTSAASPAVRDPATVGPVPAADPTPQDTSAASPAPRGPSDAGPEVAPPEPARVSEAPRKRPDPPVSPKPRTGTGEPSAPPILAGTAAGVASEAERVLRTRCRGVKGRTMVDVFLDVASAKLGRIEVGQEASPRLRSCLVRHAARAFQFAGLSSRAPKYTFVIEL